MIGFLWVYLPWEAQFHLCSEKKKTKLKLAIAFSCVKLIPERKKSMIVSYVNMFNKCNHKI